MGVPPVSDEDCARAADALRTHGGNQAAAAAECGVPRSTFQNWIKRASAKGLLGWQAVLPGYVAKVISTQSGPAGDLERTWVKQSPEPAGQFNLPEGHSIKGVSALLDSSGNVTQQWVKTKEDSENPTAIADAVRAALDGFVPAPLSEAPSATEADLATVYILADLHIGLLSWHRETTRDWDLKIAQDTIKESVSRLISTTPKSAQGVILGLGDLLHSDSKRNETTAGTRVDVDGRYPKSLRVATDLILHTVSLALQKHDTVLVRILPGNHDEQSAIAVSLALSMFYANEPRVTVDDNPGRFWWWSWGSVLLGATHGDKARMADLPLIMASRNAEAWGRSKHRHLYTGHIHTQTGIEKSGVTVESFQTPVAADAWHTEMGYGAGRSMTAITHHRVRGEILRNKVSIT